MSEEEKRVLELLNMTNVIMGCILDDKQANIILNLIDKLQKENEELRDTNKKLYEMGLQRAIQELLSENWVNKDEIREFIKKELPDDEIMECCSNYDVNGVAIRKELEKILADKE